MAEIQGDVVGVYVSTNLVTPVWKEIICGENLGVDGSRDVNSRRTKCGVKKGYGPVGWTITGSGTHETVITGTQVSSNELMTYIQDETPLLIKVATVADETLYFRKAPGQLTSYTENSNSGDPLSYDFTFDISGEFDVVTP